MSRIKDKFETDIDRKNKKNLLSVESYWRRFFYVLKMGEIETIMIE